MAMPNQNDIHQLAVALGPGGYDAAARLQDSVGNGNVAIGSSPVSTVVAKEFQDKLWTQTVLTVTNLAISTTDDGANGSFGGTKIYDMPAGALWVLARTNLTATVAAGIGATATLKHSVGTVVAATNDTLDSTKANIIASTNTTLSGSAGTVKGLTATPLIIDGTSSAVDIYLNFGVADAGATANSTVTVSGTITLLRQTIATS